MITVEGELETTSSDNVEAIRLAVEVVSLMNRYGYKLDDSKLLDVIKLCERVAVK